MGGLAAAWRSAGGPYSLVSVVCVSGGRIEKAGGRVDFQRCWRVVVEPRDGRPGSGLAVSRWALVSGVCCVCLWRQGWKGGGTCGLSALLACCGGAKGRAAWQRPCSQQVGTKALDTARDL
jgi:hypothetical protein